jgi:type IV secretion system protein VirB5
MTTILKLKRALAAAGLSLCLFGASAPAHAGIPTIDIANLIQSILEVVAWLQQGKDMVDQIEEAKNMVQEAKNTVAGIQTTISKLDGMRNLGSILNDPTIKSALPTEMQNAMGVLMSPSGVTSNAAAMSNVLASFGINVPAGGITKATALADMVLKSQAMLLSAQTRERQLTQLASQVDAAPDVKASSDLVARNTIENARIMNTLMQQIAAQELVKQQAELRDMAASQSEAARAQAYFRANPTR